MWVLGRTVGKQRATPLSHAHPRPQNARDPALLACLLLLWLSETRDARHWVRDIPGLPPCVWETVSSPALLKVTTCRARPCQRWVQTPDLPFRAGHWYTWMETKREQRKQNLYNPSGFSYHLGQGFPKSSLHITEGMGNNAFIIIGKIQGWAKVGSVLGMRNRVYFCVIAY